jgi:hypothetical protein
MMAPNSEKEALILLALRWMINFDQRLGLELPVTM